MSPCALLLRAITTVVCAAVVIGCASNKTLKYHFNEKYIDDIEYEYVEITPSIIDEIGTLNQVDPSCYSSRQLDPINYEYRVGIGDRIFVKLAVINSSEDYRESSGSDLTYILPQPHITQDETSFEIDGNGYINVPYSNPIKVVGMRLFEIQKALYRQFKRFISRPFVEVKIHQYGSQFIHVQGRVNTPSRLAIDHQPMTVSRAIQSAGGVTEDADLRHVFIQNQEGKRRYIDLFQLLNMGRLEFDLLLSAGDTLVVPFSDGNQVFVTGEVNDRKIVQTHSRTLSLTKALLEANGPHPFAADVSQIYVIRSPETHVLRNRIDPCVNQNFEPNQYNSNQLAENRLTVFHFDLSHPEIYALSNRFDLANNDVVYVSTRPITEWNRFIVQILPANISHWSDPRIMD